MICVQSVYINIYINPSIYRVGLLSKCLSFLLALFYRIFIFLSLILFSHQILSTLFSLSPLTATIRNGLKERNNFASVLCHIVLNSPFPESLYLLFLFSQSEVVPALYLIHILPVPVRLFPFFSSFFACHAVLCARSRRIERKIFLIIYSLYDHFSGPFFLLIWLLISRPRNSIYVSLNCVCVCADVSEISAIFHLILQHSLVYFFLSFAAYPNDGGPVFFSSRACVMVVFILKSPLLLLPPKISSFFYLSVVSLCCFESFEFVFLLSLHLISYIQSFILFLPSVYKNFFSPLVEFDLYNIYL